MFKSVMYLIGSIPNRLNEREFRIAVGYIECFEENGRENDFDRAKNDYHLWAAINHLCLKSDRIVLPENYSEFDLLISFLNSESSETLASRYINSKIDLEWFVDNKITNSKSFNLIRSAIFFASVVNDKNNNYDYFYKNKCEKAKIHVLKLVRYAEDTAFSTDFAVREWDDDWEGDSENDGDPCD